MREREPAMDPSVPPQNEGARVLQFPSPTTRVEGEGAPAVREEEGEVISLRAFAERRAQEAQAREKRVERTEEALDLAAELYIQYDTQAQELEKRVSRLRDVGLYQRQVLGQDASDLEAMVRQGELLLANAIARREEFGQLLEEVIGIRKVQPGQSKTSGGSSRTPSLQPPASA